MASIAWSDVTTYPGASGLSAVDPAAQAAILAFVNGTIDVRLFPLGEADPALKLARIFLAAHWATCTGTVTGDLPTAAGTIVSEGAGRLTVSYGAMSSNTRDPGLVLTAWGRAFRAVMAPYTVGGVVL